MTDSTLLYKIAKAYYEDALTQDQIGKRFGLSRIKVSRLLQLARQSRVVQITILPPADSFGDVERELEKAYGLDEVVVVQYSDDAEDIVTQLGVAAAGYLARSLSDQQVLDLSWGTTLLAVIDALASQSLPDLRVVQMLGGLGRLESETYGADLTMRMAQTLGARMRLLPSPGIVASKLVRDALLQDVNIAETLALAARADLALVGIGAPMSDSVIVEAGILNTAELAELKAMGAVGDIALRFFDAEGRAIDHAINDRIIGLDLAQIRRIPRVIGVAGGDGKYEVIRGAVRGRLVDVLITDEMTATRLLQETIPEMLMAS
ncbi:MAG: sugar-binding transcriptional regulator [Caldilinea sp.]|uniref:sugar-binding transcriptional regulator n=1 Tax=Caldilinea sp. TaxID=2293560 RepID=UPI002C0F3853|nr:sugar-binding transcriptional regulator [Anaerolineales bacterium]HQY90162.1 sugar-binding transcriptional regulator [Caldilinea sp.]